MSVFTECWRSLEYTPKPPEPIRPEDVYSGDLQIPVEYDVIGFRIPNAHEEVWLDLYGRVCVWAHTLSPNEPRLILRKVRKVVFTEIRRGSVEPGEWMSWSNLATMYIPAPRSPFKSPNVIAYCREEI